METSTFIYNLLERLQTDNYLDDESFLKLDLELRKNTTFCFSVYLHLTGQCKEDEIFNNFVDCYSKMSNNREIQKNYFSCVIKCLT